MKARILEGRKEKERSKAIRGADERNERRIRPSCLVTVAFALLMKKGLPMVWGGLSGR